MGIRVECECGKVFHLRDELAGRKGKCPQCGRVLVIPRAEPELPESDMYDLAPEEAVKPVKQALPAMPALSRTQSAPRAAPKAPAAAPVLNYSARGSGKRRGVRDYLYLVLLLALIPLAVSLVTKDSGMKEMVKRTLEKHPEVALAIFKDAGAEDAEPGTNSRKSSPAEKEEEPSEDMVVYYLAHELVERVPEHKLDGALLSKTTWAHWGMALVSALGFLTLLVLLFERKGSKPHHLLLTGLFTGTIGIVFLLVVQWISRYVGFGGIRIRGGGIAMLIWLLLMIIGYSYRAALSPETGFVTSFLGFTFGVGMCEELCKALPLFRLARREATAGWRTFMLWGLASGVGFGVSEGISYSSSFYNGFQGPEIYLVRFVSCVALHAIWSASVAITLYPRQSSVIDADDWWNWGAAVLRIIGVPMILHGLYDTLLKKDMNALALVTALASFALLAWQIERIRRNYDEDEEEVEDGVGAAVA